MKLWKYLHSSMQNKALWLDLASICLIPMFEEFSREEISSNPLARSCNSFPLAWPTNWSMPGERSYSFCLHNLCWSWYNIHWRWFPGAAASVLVTGKCKNQYMTMKMHTIWISESQSSRYMPTEFCVSSQAVSANAYRITDAMPKRCPTTLCVHSRDF